MVNNNIDIFKLKEVTDPIYLKTAEAAKYFGVSQNTIRSWEDRGLIDVIRTNSTTGYGHRRYDITSYKKKAKKEIPQINKILKQQIISEIQLDTILNESIDENDLRKTICYCRSNDESKDSLADQNIIMAQQFPDCELINDIGSGSYLKRNGLTILIDKIIKGEISGIIIAHKDILANQNHDYEFIEWLFKKFNTNIIDLNNPKFKMQKQELSDDIISFVRSCSERL